MPRTMAQVTQRLIIVLAVCVSTMLVPRSATAASDGLSPPRAMTKPGQTVLEPMALVAPTGRTALFWSRDLIDRADQLAGIHDHRTLVRLGPSPEHLGKATPIAGVGGHSPRGV